MITLVDCGCKTKVHADGSGVEIEFCNLHYAAPDLLAACVFAVEELDNMTTEQFAFGADKSVRDRLAAAIQKAREG